MKPVAIIPARWGSTRFPGKPLVQLAGRPLVVHVLDACRRSGAFSDVRVATDDDRIAGGKYFSIQHVERNDRPCPHECFRAAIFPRRNKYFGDVAGRAIHRIRR